MWIWRWESVCWGESIHAHNTKQNIPFHHTTPHYTIPHHTTLHYTTPHHTTLHYTTAHHTTPRHTTPRHTAPHHTTPHHSTAQHTTPHHTTPHHTTLYLSIWCAYSTPVSSSFLSVRSLAISITWRRNLPSGCIPATFIRSNSWQVICCISVRVSERVSEWESE